MNLNELSLPELSRLQDALSLIHQGASILSALPMSGDHDLIVHLRPGELVTITTHFQMPNAFVPAQPIEPVIVIEDAAAAAIPDDFEERTGYLAAGADAVLHQSDDLAARAEAVQISFRKESGAVAATPAPVVRAAPEPAKVAGDATGQGGGKGIAAPGDGSSLGQVLSGPLTASERAEIVRLRKQGLASKDISAALNRRVQTMSLFLNAQGLLTEPKQSTAPAHPASSAAKTEGPQASADTGQASAAAQGNACAAPETPSATQMTRVVAVAPAVKADSRPLRQREIGLHLEQVRPRKGFDAELDLDLVEGVARGDKLDMISADLGVDVAALSHRWRDLTDALRDEKNRIAIDDQSYLLLELRRMVAEARSAA